MFDSNVIFSYPPVTMHLRRQGPKLRKIRMSYCQHHPEILPLILRSFDSEIDDFSIIQKHTPELGYYQGGRLGAICMSDSAKNLTRLSIAMEAQFTEYDMLSICYCVHLEDLVLRVDCNLTALEDTGSSPCVPFQLTLLLRCCKALKKCYCDGFTVIADLFCSRSPQPQERLLESLVLTQCIVDECIINRLCTYFSYIGKLYLHQCAFRTLRTFRPAVPHRPAFLIHLPATTVRQLRVCNPRISIKCGCISGNVEVFGVLTNEQETTDDDSELEKFHWYHVYAERGDYTQCIECGCGLTDICPKTTPAKVNKIDDKKVITEIFNEIGRISRLAIEEERRVRMISGSQGSEDSAFTFSSIDQGNSVGSTQNPYGLVTPPRDIDQGTELFECASGMQEQPSFDISNLKERIRADDYVRLRIKSVAYLLVNGIAYLVKYGQCM